MDLRLPVIATVVTAAGLVAGVRALHHDAAPFSSADVAAASPGPLPSPGQTTSRGRRELGRDPALVTVYVAGDVARAGVYALPSGSRAVDALKAAGGASGGADLVAVNLAEPLSDGEEIVVPVEGADPAAGATASASHGKRSHPARRTKKRHRRHRSHRASASADASTSADAAASSADAASTSADAAASTGAARPDIDAPTETIDLNSADENELEMLPGIGAALAERIVAFRELNGPFGSPDDLLDVGGMTQGRLDAIAPYVTIR